MASTGQNAGRSRRPRLAAIHPNAAGIDVGATFHVVAVPPDRCDETVRTFQSFTGDLYQLADWLRSVGVDTVAMEIDRRLLDPRRRDPGSPGFEVLLANARDAKNVPGRRTDVNDAQWLQQLHTYGLMRGSARQLAATRR